MVGFMWHVGSSKQINLNLPSWVFRSSAANRLPAESALYKMMMQIFQQNHLPDLANVLVSCSVGSLLEERCKQEGSWFGFNLISPGLYMLKRASTQKKQMQIEG